MCAKKGVVVAAHYVKGICAGGGVTTKTSVLGSYIKPSNE